MLSRLYLLLVVLTRIELTNFMSHAHTVIEPAAGLTVLVGPNNCGKSAIVAALQILCHNETSTYVLRHGQRECSVEVETIDGHTVRWTRKNSPSYLIDGQLFDRLRGAGIPDQLHQALRLPKVDAGEDANFDVHFGAQKSPIFLLGSSAATAARFFASSSDAIRLVEMQRRHKEKLAEKQRQKTRLEAESKQLNAELETLQPAVRIEQQLRDAEIAYVALQQGQSALALLVHEASLLDRQSLAVANCAERAAALASLGAPPQLADAGAVETLLDRLRAVGDAVRRAESDGVALESLGPPPRIDETAALERLIERLHLMQTATVIEHARAGRWPRWPRSRTSIKTRRMATSIAAQEKAKRQAERLQASLSRNGRIATGDCTARGSAL